MRTRMMAALAAIGAIAGGGVALVVHFTTQVRPDAAVSYHGRYELLQNIGQQAYSSTLRITLDPVRPGWLPMLPLYVGAGVVVGLLAAVVLARLRGRRVGSV